MTMSTMTTSDAKNTEFARLYDLFERLASCRPQSVTSTINGGASVDDMSNSQEIDPVLNKLSSLIDSSKARTRPRRNTVASIVGRIPDNGNIAVRVSEDSTSCDSSEDEDDDIASLAKFPLANTKKYLFTFRHMVHKLYKKDDWAKTIREMLEKSKNEFKTLAEQKATAVAPGREQEETDVEEMGGAVRFKVATETPGGGGRRGSIIAMGRQRSQSVVGSGAGFRLPFSPGLKSPGSTNSHGKQPDIRALKKRCVGRRKSMSGPLDAENDGVGTSSGKNRGTWVYDAAISSSEHPIASAISPPGSPLSPTPATGRLNYQPLAMNNLPNMVHGGAEMKRRGSIGCDVPLMMPLQQVTNMNTGGLAARRRAALKKKDDDAEEEQRKPMKRRFPADD